eukprot:288686-Rhodomonas_salina.1
MMCPTSSSPWQPAVSTSSSFPQAPSRLSCCGSLAYTALDGNLNSTNICHHLRLRSRAIPQPRLRLPLGFETSSPSSPTCTDRQTDRHTDMQTLDPRP